MRIAGPDVVLFVVGLLLVGGSAYGIKSMGEGFGGTSSALGLFEVSWNARTEAVGEEQVPNLRSATQDFEVNTTHVGSLIVTVSCQDQAGALPVSFQIQVRVTGPNGLTGEGSGACASGVSVPVEVAAAPEDTVVRGATDTEARENLPASENATRAVGAWTVEVSGARGGGTPVGGVPVADPAGTITLEAEVYDPRLTPVQR